MTWVKICGTTNTRDARMSVAAGADALGFIFTPSPRQVDVAQAADIVAALPAEVEKIGVFVNETPQRVAEIAGRVGLTGVQLHGEEAAGSLPEFRRALGERKIIKTLQADELLNISKDGVAVYLAERSSIDAILLDSGSLTRRGGTGATFPWKEAASLAAAIQAAVPLIVAGGLKPENIADALRILNPWGVDVVSGVESAPGTKDDVKLRDFVAAVRRAQVATP